MNSHMNTINIQTYVNKKEYILYIPFYYFKNEKIKQEDIDNNFINCKKFII